jgi:hypothetical protein
MYNGDIGNISDEGKVSNPFAKNRYLGTGGSETRPYISQCIKILSVISFAHSTSETAANNL